MKVINEKRLKDKYHENFATKQIWIFKIDDQLVNYTKKISTKEGQWRQISKEEVNKWQVKYSELPSGSLSRKS